MFGEATVPGTGVLVHVRQRTYLVEDVAVEADASPVVRLACVDDDAQGQKLEVIWDAEVDAQVIPSGRSVIRQNPTPDDPKTFAAYLQALRWGCVTSTDPTLFQAPLRAGIVPKSYQLEPLRKALALPRVNLFIADDVGLGKTIEAGLVLQELLLRQRVHRVVVACPASVLLQWRDELSQRFGISFVVFDKAYVNARRRERGFGVNAWTTHRHFLISHNLLRDEEYLTGLREWLGRFCPGSLFILDEAHVAAPSAESRYARDSQTTLAVREIARLFEHRLFLSATPHNGHSNSFSTLLEILDPQRFTRGVPVKNASLLRPVMVRRLKGELRRHLGSQIPERKTVQIDIGVDDLPPNSPELVLPEKLAEYSEILERRLAASNGRVRAAGKLVSIALQKRLLSSIEAFARTLAVHRLHAAKKRANTLVSVPIEEHSQNSLFADEADLSEEQTAELEALEMARATQASAAAADDARGQELLEEMSLLADRARNEPDAKVRRLLDWIRVHQCPDLLADGRKAKSKAAWLPRRVLIFTEYSDTKNYLQQQLEFALAGTDQADDRVLTLHGGMDEESRERVKQAFNDAQHPVRILIGTDAAREGVNLQAQCADLFHFDVPWNPGRMEQRNGRIDRMLQPSSEVRCHYFVYLQRPEDTVLAALVEKTQRIQKELGSLAEVIERRLADTLQNGIRRASMQALVSSIVSADQPDQGAHSQAVQDELEQARDRELVEQLEDLKKLDQKGSEHLALKPERLRDVVNLGLALAGAPPLRARKSPAGSYDVPPLDELPGADATWRDIMDTLRAPRTRKMPEWEWRSKNPPRPISFEPATTLAAETVQLHLSHKLTQRVMAQFRAQAFGEERLSRVAVVCDPTYKRNRVLCIGRLSLYGAGASRLHEELLITAAIWVEGDDPARLTPFETSEAEERAIESLYSVLSRPDARPVPEHIVRMLMASAHKDDEALWSTLRSRSQARIDWAQDRLRQRARVEADEMRRILTAQREALDRELQKRQQIVMPWALAEREQKDQYEADTRHIERRRSTLDQELPTEPRRIEELYEVKHHRLERVGLVYLWPTTS